MRNGLLTRGILWLGTLLFPALPPLQAAHDLAKQPLTVAADDAFSTLPLLAGTDALPDKAFRPLPERSA